MDALINFSQCWLAQREGAASTVKVIYIICLYIVLYIHTYVYTCVYVYNLYTYNIYNVYNILYVYVYGNWMPRVHEARTLTVRVTGERSMPIGHHACHAM